MWWHQRLAIVRGFARYLQASDPRHEVPPVNLLSAKFRRAVPYLYSEAEIEALMRAAGRIRSPLNAATYQTLIGLLSVTGMRIGEAIALDRADIELPEGRLTVRRGKHGRSREVALHATTVTALDAYARLRDEFCPRVKDPSFLITNTGMRLHKRTIGNEFLSYTFRPRLSKNKYGKHFLNFTPAVSGEAKTRMRREMRRWGVARRSDKTLTDLALMFNRQLQGWIGYYGKFYKSMLYPVFRHFNDTLVRWAMRKYKRLRRHRTRARRFIADVARRQPALFAHWRFGVRPDGWTIGAR